MSVRVNYHAGGEEKMRWAGDGCVRRRIGCPESLQPGELDMLLLKQKLCLTCFCLLSILCIVNLR